MNEWMNYSECNLNECARVVAYLVSIETSYHTYHTEIKSWIINLIRIVPDIRMAGYPAFIDIRYPVG